MVVMWGDPVKMSPVSCSLSHLSLSHLSAVFLTSKITNDPPAPNLPGEDTSPLQDYIQFWVRLGAHPIVPETSVSRELTTNSGPQLRGTHLVVFCVALLKVFTPV